MPISILAASARALLRWLPKPLHEALDQWSYRVARRHARRRKEQALEGGRGR